MLEIRKLELDLKLRLATIADEAKVREAEAKKEAKIEANIREDEAKIRDQEHELKMKELELKVTKPSKPRFDAGQCMKLVPKFDENDLDCFFAHFEKVAERCEWPPDKYTLLLQSCLVGKARDAYTALDKADSEDYVIVKRKILKAYELVSEAYRRKCCDVKNPENQTWVDFAEQSKQC